MKRMATTTIKTEAPENEPQNARITEFESILGMTQEQQNKQLITQQSEYQAVTTIKTEPPENDEEALPTNYYFYKSPINDSQTLAANFNPNDKDNTSNLSTAQEVQRQGINSNYDNNLSLLMEKEKKLIAALEAEKRRKIIAETHSLQAQLQLNSVQEQLAATQLQLQTANNRIKQAEEQKNKTKYEANIQFTDLLQTL